MSECLTTKAKPNKGLKDSYHGHKRCRFMLNVVYSLEKTLTIQNIHLILIDIWTLNFLNGVLEWILAIFRPPSPSNSYFFFSTQGGKYCSASPLVIGFMDRFSRWRQTGRPEIPQNYSTAIDLRIV